MKRVLRSRYALSVCVTLVLAMVMTMCLGMVISSFERPIDDVFAAVDGETYTYSKMKYVDSYIPKVNTKDGSSIGFGGIDSAGLTDADGGSLGIDNYIFDKSNTNGLWGRNAVNNSGAKLYTGWQDNQSFAITDFSQFAASANQQNKKGTGADNDGYVHHSDKSLYYRAKAGDDNGYKCWMYFYGYIKLPINLTELGGKLTISVDTSGYYDDGGEGYKFFSVVAGNRLVNNYNGTGNADKSESDLLRASDIVMNTKTGRTHVASSIKAPNNNEGSSKIYITTPSNNTKQTVTIDIRPGEKYVRVSFVNLFARASTIFNNNAFGQRISNLNASYELDQVAPTITNEGATISADKTSATISADVVDDVSGIEKVTIKSDALAETNMTKASGSNKYSYIAKKDGMYTITATDHTGKITRTTVLVNGVFVGKLTTKDVNMTIVDSNADGYVSENELITITVKNDTYGKKITDINVPNATTKTLKYNYGIEAVWEVTFDGSKTANVEVTAVYETITLPIHKRIVVNGKEESNEVQNLAFGYKDGYKYTAPNKYGDGMKFLGWFDSQGVLLTTDSVVKFAVTKAETYEARYVTRPATYTMVEFRDLSGTRVLNNMIYSGTLRNTNEEQIMTAVNGLGYKAHDFAFNTFKGWKFVSFDANADKVVVKPIYETTGAFDVTIKYADGTLETLSSLAFNHRVDLVGKDTTAQGWAIDGVKVSDKDSYYFYVTADMTIEEIKSEPQDIATITSSKTADGITVVTGNISTAKTYIEKGLLIADSNILDEDIRVENNLVKLIKVHNIAPSGQFIVNIRLMKDVKILVYMIDNVGNIEYSKVKMIVSNKEGY